MPSTYTVNLGIEKPATGEQSGTWGDTVNDNSNILDEAINGAVAIVLSSAGSSGSPTSITITNGASSTGRNKWIEFTDGGDLGAAAYVQLTPNDAEKICFIRNSLTSSRSIFIFQGTYSTSNDLEIAAGTDVLVKFNGGGTGATVVNVNANLAVNGIDVAGLVEFNSLSGTGSVAITDILDQDDMSGNSATALATQQSIKAYVDAQVDTVDTLAEVLAIGNTSGGTDVELTTTDKVQFRDAAIYLNSSVDGQLDIVADTEIQLVATTVDLNGALDVSGTVTATGTSVFASLDISGDVDIDGTTNLDIVDIDGAVNLAADVTYADGADIITASAGTSNFRAGVNAGNSIESGGNYNVVVGDEAGTAITTGDNNVAVGYKALEVDNTGSNNTALGYSALEANTTAADNVAVGYKALELNSTGASNTALGKQAMQSNTTASNGTAVGFSALYANTTGRDNTAVGYSAGITNTTGLENTALGMYALRFNTTGNTNTALGLQALHRNTTASDNTAVGRNSMEQNLTGAQNTIIGSLCHDNLTTGDLNTALGYNLAPSAVDVASEIVIGSSITGAGTNTVRIGTGGGTATLGLDGSDTSWAAASDVRLKKDVADSTVGLSFLNALRPITFKWQHKNAVAEDLPQYDADSSDPIFGEGKAHHGFIAQEVKAVIDDHSDVLDGNNIWHEDPDGTQQLSQGNLVPMLVKAVQELSAKIAELEAQPRCKCNGE
jgi:hypothetical protein